MRLSELISRLQRQLERRGDVEVVIAYESVAGNLVDVFYGRDGEVMVDMDGMYQDYWRHPDDPKVTDTPAETPPRPK